MWNEWERVFSETKAKSRTERELVCLSFSLKNLNQGSGWADAQDFQVATCSHIPAQGAQVPFREQSVWVQHCSKVQNTTAFSLDVAQALSSYPIIRQ